MNYLRPRLTIIYLLCLFAPILCNAAELFSSPRQKAGFLKALSKQDARYDPAEKMIRRPFSSPGYHTTLKGGYVHPPRDSLNYAVALLDSGEPARLKRAQDILRKVISLQDQDPKSRTYGIWSWFAEEPLEKMSPPDWNWADFCGTQLLQVAHDHMHRLPDELQRQVKDSIIHAAYSIKRRNVGPGYTNIAVMGTYVTLTSGELFGVDELVEYGRKRLKRFYDYTFEQGSFREYNSPTPPHKNSCISLTVSLGTTSPAIFTRRAASGPARTADAMQQSFATAHSPSFKELRTARLISCPKAKSSNPSMPTGLALNVPMSFSIISLNFPNLVWKSKPSPETLRKNTTSSALHTFILITRSAQSISATSGTRDARCWPTGRQTPAWWLCACAVCTMTTIIHLRAFLPSRTNPIFSAPSFSPPTAATHISLLTV
jgi:hypothetical protein